MPRTKKQISCLEQQLASSPNVLNTYATCAKETATAYNKCLGNVAECNRDAILDCGSPVEKPPCLENVNMEALDPVIEKCAQSGK